jgi:hypothetical protein
MIRNGEEVNQVKQLQPIGRQAATLQLVVPGCRIAGIGRAQQGLSVSVAPSSTLLASAESFITDWADS